MTHTTVLAFGLALVLTFAATRLVVVLAARFSWFARREQRQALGYHRVARLGGIAMATVFTLLALILPAVVGSEIAPVWMRSATVWIAGSAVFAIGLVDDLRPVSARVKLLALLLAGAAVAHAGFGITRIPFLPSLHCSHTVTVLLTAGWFAMVGTAWNFIDGLDGLAAGLASLACMVFWLVGSHGDGFAAALITGVSLGFLGHNRHPSRIFMGDSGSFFLGFWIAILGISGSDGGLAPKISGPVFLALAWPLADLCWAVWGRMRRHNLFSASSDHLHYWLNDRVGHRWAVQLALMCAAALAVASVGVRGGLHLALAMAAASTALWLFCGRARPSLPTLASAAYVVVWLMRTVLSPPTAAGVPRLDPEQVAQSFGGVVGRS